MQAARGATLTVLPPADDASSADPSASVDPNPRPRPRRAALYLLAGMALLALALDLVSKVLVVANVDKANPIRLLGGFITIVNHERNSGAAFSIGAGSARTTVVLGVIAFIVIFVILRVARRLGSLWWGTALGLVLGGAAGNLVDRLFRSPGVFRGHVVDWIQVPNFAVFNVADSAIVGGGILIAALSMIGLEIDGSRTRSRKDEPAAP